MGEAQGVARQPHRARSMTRSARRPTSAAGSPPGTPSLHRGPAGVVARGSRRWSGPRSPRSPTRQVVGDLGHAPRSRPARQVSVARTSGLVEHQGEGVGRPGALPGRSAWASPSGARGRSVRPVWRPVAAPLGLAVADQEQPARFGRLPWAGHHARRGRRVCNSGAVTQPAGNESSHRRNVASGCEER